ncbi:hypothetical protein [Haloquadratum walsbyi]|uniref:hypothetical protein n=1 Tax=Haloquadratum walsbyi TaxID=293091 RepID=UPI0026F1BA93|nr:hypothetical protein [Haloquadratum walsbyi]
MRAGTGTGTAHRRTPDGDWSPYGTDTDTGKIRSESVPAKTVVETGSPRETKGSPILKSGAEMVVSVSD